MLFALDEAQCELSDGNNDEENHAFYELISHIYRGKQATYEGSSFVAAGTSLQLDRFKKVFEDNVTHSVDVSE